MPRSGARDDTRHERQRRRNLDRQRCHDGERLRGDGGDPAEAGCDADVRVRPVSAVASVTARRPAGLVRARQGRPLVEHSARFGRSLAAGPRRYAEQRPSPQTITLAQLFASWDRAFDSAERAIRSAEQEKILGREEAGERERRLCDERRRLRLLAAGESVERRMPPQSRPRCRAASAGRDLRPRAYSRARRGLA